MNIPDDDKDLLIELCRKYNLSSEKVLRLLKVIREYEDRDKRIGVNESLKEIISTNYSRDNDN